MDSIGTNMINFNKDLLALIFNEDFTLQWNTWANKILFFLKANTNSRVKITALKIFIIKNQWIKLKI